MSGKRDADNFRKAASQHAESIEKIKNDQQKTVDQTKQEEKIAIREIYEMAGKIKTMKFQKSQSDFFHLLMLKQVKDAKEYRDQMGMSWQDFCDYVGVDRRRIDEQLADLKPFKVEFLADFANFSGVTINRIKYLGEAVTGKLAEIAGNLITYNGETIPVDPDHTEDIQVLIETLEENHKKEVEEKSLESKAKDRVLRDKEKLISKLTKNLEILEGKAREKNMTPAEEGFLKQVEFLRTAFDGYMLQLDPERIEELASNAEPTPRMRAAYLSALDYMKKQILVAYEQATEMYGNAIMCPDAAWKPGMGAAITPAKDTASKKSK